MAPAQLSVGLGFDCRVGEEARAAWAAAVTGRTASLPRLMKGLRRQEEEIFAEVYQPLVAEPAKQEELLKLHPRPIRVFYRIEHCSQHSFMRGITWVSCPTSPKEQALAGNPPAPACPCTQQPKSSWSRLRAPALEGCAKPQSCITVCHREKGESALPD